MSSRLVFSPARHTYSLDGERVPGVTTVIGKATGKPGLVKWSARLAAEWAATHRDELDQLGEEEWVKVATAASDRARDLGARNGTLLHQLAVKLLYGDPLPDADDQGAPYPTEIRLSAEQLARFMDSWQVTPIVHEVAVFHEEHRWAGTLDLVADLADGKRWLLDWKTGSSGVWPEMALQLAAYRHATHVQVGDRDMLMTPVDRAACVWVRPDGWELIPVRADADTYEVFRHMLPVAEWASAKRDTYVGAPVPVPA